MEKLGDLSLHWHLSLRSAWICLFNGSRDLLRHLMLGGHRIWSIFPAPPSLTPNFGVEFLKLFLKSPSTPESHGISCHGKNDSTVVYLAGITAPALLLLQALMTVVALEIFRKRIPRKFISKYGGGLSNTVFLKLPNGAEWKIELTKGDGDVWLQKGWDEFTKHHSINLGHLLVFRYEGNSHFYVLIFEPSATEIDYPFDDKPQVPEMENIESDDNSVEIIDDFWPSRKTMEKSPSLCVQPHKRTKTNPCSSDLHPGDPHFRPEVTKSKGTILEKSKMKAGVSCTRRESKAKCSGATKICLKSERIQPLSPSEKDRALHRARAFESKNPFFMIVMQPSYIHPGHTSNISSNFAKEYLRKTNSDAILCVSDGATWSVKVKFRESRTRKITQTRAEFGIGWKTFAQDNNLKVGDVCVLELINNIEVAFKVAIFRDAKDRNCPLWNGSSQESDCSMALKAKAKKQDFTTNGTTRNHVRAGAFKSENPFFYGYDATNIHLQG